MPGCNRRTARHLNGITARYEAEIADACPAAPDGTVLLPFPRPFFIATR